MSETSEIEEKSTENPEANEDSSTEKAVESGEVRERTLGEVYDGIDKKIQDFTKELMEFLPASKYTAINQQIIVDRLLTIKESAKLLVNNYAGGLQREKEQEDAK